MNVAFLRTLLIAGALAAAGVETALSQVHEPPAEAGTSTVGDAGAWDATWIGGWEGGEATQVVIAGGAVVGFFWAGNYLSIESSTSFADGGGVKFIYPGGEAVVEAGRDGELVLLIHETGRPEIGFTLKRE
jgi:hypothetical protein